jgi:hypothetical protein
MLGMLGMRSGMKLRSCGCHSSSTHSSSRDKKSHSSRKSKSSSSSGWKCRYQSRTSLMLLPFLCVVMQRRQQQRVQRQQY